MIAAWSVDRLGRSLQDLVGFLGELQAVGCHLYFARARAEGKTLGRKPVKPAVEQRIRALRAKGMGILKIGKTIGVGTSVVQRVIAAT